MTRLTFVSSRCPRFYDPSLPNFHPPKNYAGHWVRIRVLLSSKSGDYRSRLELERKAAEKKYPGARIYVVPEFSEQSHALSKFDGSESDSKKLKLYLDETVPSDLEERKGEIFCFLDSCLKKVGAQNSWTPSKIKFESVSASNTLSFRKVNLQFDEPGIYLVVGENKTWRNNSNAAGKSNLFSILRIGLYGSTTKYQRHDAICRRWMGKGKKSWVRVRLKDAEDHSVSVLRGRRPKHILRVLRDQKEVGSGNQKQATQEVINRMCGFTEEVFDHSVLIDQKLLHTAQSFLYGTDKDKKQLLDQVLGIGHFLKVGEVVKQKYANWSLEEAEVKERLREGREKISYLGAHIRSLEKTRHRQSVLREVKSFKLALAKLNYRKEVTEKAERKIKFFSKKCSEFYSIYTKRSLAVQSIVDKRMRFEGEIERCEKLAAKKCPTCRQMVSAKLVSDWVRELESSLKESRIFEEKQKKELDILKSEFITLEERKAKWERIAKKCNTEKVQFILLTEKIRTLKKNLKRAPETVLLKRMRSERASWRMKQKVYSQTLSAFRQDGQFWNYCLSVFSREGLVNFIYAGLCRSLNASAKFYSDVFTDGIIQLRFEPQTTRKSGKVVNEFQVRVFNTQGGENQNDQSRGEEQLAALMCVLCLRDVGPKSNLLILDEPVEGLDVENSISFARGLKKISDRIPTIFLATHNEYVKSEFRSANTIKIIKEKRISRIEEN